METNMSILPADGYNCLANIGILPEDILVEVLSRLPVKHLLRLRCVSKSWRALIADVNFIMRHYQFHYSVHKLDGDIPLFLTVGGGPWEWGEYFRVFFLSRQRGIDDVHLRELTDDLVRDTANFLTAHPNICVGVANGVICFFWKTMEFGLWNPATREFKPVAPPFPQSRPNCSLVGFGYDHVSNDFKILQKSFGSGSNFEYNIYSLTSNTWKRLREPPFSADPLQTYPMHAYLKGVCYWYASYSKSTGRGILSRDSKGILFCNLQTEVFEVFDLPQGAVGPKVGYEYYSRITLYMESLAFVVSCTDLGKTARTFDIWVVTSFHGDSGIPVSWQRLFTIGPFPSADGLILDTFRMNGDVLFLKWCESDDEQTSLYNPSAGTFKNLVMGFNTFPGYIESLLPLSKRLVRS